MCFFGFLRSGEVVVPSESSFDPAAHLAQGEVRVDSTAFPRYLEVRIKASKTDPFRRGVTVFLGVSGEPPRGHSSGFTTDAPSLGSSLYHRFVKPFGQLA